MERKGKRRSTNPNPTVMMNAGGSSTSAIRTNKVIPFAHWYQSAQNNTNGNSSSSSSSIGHEHQQPSAYKVKCKHQRSKEESVLKGRKELTSEAKTLPAEMKRGVKRKKPESMTKTAANSSSIPVYQLHSQPNEFKFVERKDGGRRRSDVTKEPKKDLRLPTSQSAEMQRQMQLLTQGYQIPKTNKKKKDDKVEKINKKEETNLPAAITEPLVNSIAGSLKDVAVLANANRKDNGPKEKSSSKRHRSPSIKSESSLDAFSNKEGEENVKPKRPKTNKEKEKVHKRKKDDKMEKVNKEGKGEETKQPAISEPIVNSIAGSLKDEVKPAVLANANRKDNGPKEKSSAKRHRSPSIKSESSLDAFSNKEDEENVKTNKKKKEKGHKRKKDDKVEKVNKEGKREETKQPAITEPMVNSMAGSLEDEVKPSVLANRKSTKSKRDKATKEKSSSKRHRSRSIKSESSLAAFSNKEDEENVKPMTVDEIRVFAAEFDKLTGEEQVMALDIIHSRELIDGKHKEDEVEIEIENLKSSVFRELEVYVAKCLRKKRRKLNCEGLQNDGTSTNGDDGPTRNTEMIDEPKSSSNKKDFKPKHRDAWLKIGESLDYKGRRLKRRVLPADKTQRFLAAIEETGDGENKLIMKLH